MRGTMERPSSSSWRAFVSPPFGSARVAYGPRVASPARGIFVHW
jgi:hypothetical protein